MYPFLCVTSIALLEIYIFYCCGFLGDAILPRDSDITKTHPINGNRTILWIVFKVLIWVVGYTRSAAKEDGQSRSERKGSQDKATLRHVNIIAVQLSLGCPA